MSSPYKKLLEIKALSKYYSMNKGIGRRKQGYIRAVEKISFHIKEGETLAVVGESGCGKSSLAKTLLLLEKPSEGDIFFQGVALNRLSPRKFYPYKKQMQMVFQDPYLALDPRQTAGEAIAEVFTIHEKIPALERREKVQQLLQEVGLEKTHEGFYPYEFSGGQRQRVCLARAIALRPRFLICDEPVSALDVSIQAQILQLLKRIQQLYHLTYLFISHDLAVVRHFCDRVLVLYLGQIMEEAPIEKIYASPRHPYTQFLLASVPRLQKKIHAKKIILHGEQPHPTDPPLGCPFSSRCPLVLAKCYQEKPPLIEIEPEHRVACHRSGEEWQLHDFV